MKKLVIVLVSLLMAVNCFATTTVSVTAHTANTTALSATENTNNSNLANAINTHNAATTGEHGVSGTIVGTTDTQTLTNKTLTSPTITTSPTAAGATWTSLGTVTTADINGGTIDGTAIGGSSTAAIAGTTGTFSGALTGTTLNTGQGANELYDMDQNVLIASKPSFAGVTLTDASSIAATKGFYFDGGGNTYVVEGSADNINFFAGGTSAFLVASDRISIPALARIYLDGNSDTYISETSPDVIGFTANAGTICTFSAAGTALQLAASTGSDVVYTSATGALNYVSSSKRYKENIRPSESLLTKVLKLKPSRYDRKDGSYDNELGLIAEEVYPLFPEIVPLDKDGKPDSVSYSRLSVILLKAVQEQAVQIADLTKRIEKLEAK